MEKEQSFIKKDTTENWNKAKRFIPKENEVIVYTDAGTKIGDGKTLLHELSFINQNFYSVEGTTLIIETNEKQEIGN